MTTNLKIQLANDWSATLSTPPNSSDSTLLLKLSGCLLAWNNGVAEDNNGLVNLTMAGLGTGFPVNETADDNVTSNDIGFVEITGPTSNLTTICNLICLKDGVKGLGDNAQGECDFELIIDKDLSNQNDHWDIRDNTDDSSKKVLHLTVADFGGVLDASKISIDDTIYHHEDNNKIQIVENRADQKQELLDLENLIENTSKPKYGEVRDLFFGPDGDLPDPTGDPDLGTPPDPTTGISATGLWAYYCGETLLRDEINEDPNNVKHIIFGLRRKSKKIYGEWIECLIFLEEFRRIGITTKSQLTIVSSNYGEKCLREFCKEQGFYEGFPITDPNLTTYFDSADNKLKVKEIDPTKPVRYTEENIDNFREFATGYTGPNSDIFAKEMTIKDKNGNDVQVFANRKPEECFGFQPGDVIFDGSDYVYVNGYWKFEGRSKIFCDILSAQNAEEAMDLTFYGKDYDEPRSDNADRKGNPNQYDGREYKKYPNVNLQFDEVKDWSRLDTLKHYYDALKDFDNCEWRVAGDDKGHGAADAPKYDDPDIQREIDEGYELAKKFVTDYEKLLTANIASLSKTQLEEVKTKLEKWKNTRFYTSGGVWKPVIDNFLVEVNGALSSADWKAELAGLKNRSSGLAKKIYQNCQPDQDGFTKLVFEELKKLVKLLEEAHGTKTSNTKTKLEQFISDSKNDANKKKALEVAKKVKNQDSDSEDCVASAREKLKEPGEKKLEAARQRLKSLLTGLKIDGKDAYQEVVANIKNSETQINKAIEIFQKLKEIDRATNDDKGELLNALNNLKNGANEAWKAINKYKKDGQGQGYADQMLKKLNDWVGQRKNNYQDVKNANSKAEFQKAKEEFKKKHEYSNNQRDYDEIYFPLAEKAAEIREKGTSAEQEEKDLAELMVLVVSDYSDWKTQLEDLEEKLNELKGYEEGSEKHNIVENYSTVQKEALQKLIKISWKRKWRNERTKKPNLKAIVIPTKTLLDTKNHWWYLELRWQ